MFFLMFGSALFAQEVVPFKNKQLINSQTTIIPGGFDFTIQHRFGAIGLDDSFYKDFLGFDLPANIRFSLSYKISDRSYIGLGRTKVGKTLDFEAKHLFFEQNTEKGKPVSVAVFFQAGLNTEPFGVVTQNMFFEDSTVLFENKFSHRIDYTTQIVVSRAFNKKLSLQLTPTFIYKNLVVGGKDKHSTFVLPVSGRYKYSFGSSILFEYGLKLNNYSCDRIDNAFSLGLEFGTAGHVFQVFATNSYYIREGNIYTKGAFDIYDEHLFSLGFNIRRVWWF